MPISDERAVELIGKIDDLRSEFDGAEVIAAAGREIVRKNRRNFWIFVVVDLAFTVVVGFLGLNNRHEQHRLQRVEARVVAVRTRDCERANHAADANHKLWTNILDSPPQPGQKPPPAAVIESFRHLIDQTFATIDCSRLR